MYTQAILLKAKRAKRKSARIEDDVAEKPMFMVY